jgi:predicted transcriptional regulator
MTDSERAVQAIEKLPEDMQERVVDNLVHYVDKYLALRDDIAIGVAQLDRGEWVDADEAMSRILSGLAA